MACQGAYSAERQRAEVAEAERDRMRAAYAWRDWFGKDGSPLDGERELHAAVDRAREKQHEQVPVRHAERAYDEVELPGIDRLVTQAAREIARRPQYTDGIKQHVYVNGHDLAAVEAEAEQSE